MWIPRGFAHGFAVLSKEAIFAYKCDNYYNHEADGGICFDDPALNIQWPIPVADMCLSEKDKKQAAFREVDCFLYSEMA